MNSLHRNIGLYSESVLLQLRSLMKVITQEQYVAKYPIFNQSAKQLVHTDSAIGSHVRHIYDHYGKVLALSRSDRNNGSVNGTVLSYDIRTRGTDVESNLASAIDMNDVLVKRLAEISIDQHMMDMSVSISHVTDGAGSQISLPSTLARELVFVSHHGIHHVATVKSLILTHYPDIDMGEVSIVSDIGKAPSTINLDNKEIPAPDTR